MVSAGSEIHFEVAKQAAMLNGLDTWLLGNTKTLEPFNQNLFKSPQINNSNTLNHYSNSKASTSDNLTAVNGSDYFKHENLNTKQQNYVNRSLSASELYGLVSF